MSDPQVKVTREGPVAVVLLDRPDKRNALSPEMVVRLARFWKEAADDPDLRVIVVTGAGDKAFCSGGDLGTLIPIMMRTREPQDEWEAALAADRKQLGAALLRTSGFFKPVIAAINGHAHAGGAEFAFATDLRVMADDATLAVTEVRRGLIASGGSLVRLPRQVAWAHAAELLLLGEPVDARRALEMGLVNRVAPRAEVLPVALELARRMAQGAPVALEKTKEVMVRTSGMALDEAFAIETQCTKENAATDVAKEGPRAFMQKRPPVFTGRRPA
jgi:enoyl-CoA hydratase